MRGVCEAPQGGQRAQGECVDGRRGVALPRSAQAPCSIRSVSIGPQFLPQVTVLQSSIATPNCYFVRILLVPLPIPKASERRWCPGRAPPGHYSRALQGGLQTLCPSYRQIFFGGMSGPGVGYQGGRTQGALHWTFRVRGANRSLERQPRVSSSRRSRSPSVLRNEARVCEC